MDLQPNRSFTKNDLESMLLDEAAEPRALPFSLLENITNNFSYKQEIGRGGFAVVYMGMLENGAVAVKRLSNTYEYETEFLREVECLVKVKHKNIVRFLGYCSDTQGNVAFYNRKFVMADIQERLLCFEFLPMGSLDNYIKDASGGLDWKTRYGIIKGICDGLHYFHHRNIVHLDLKPSNVLMDDNMIPKITDFGLSRILEEMQTRVLATKMFGTLGYLAPEFTSNVITHKFDLYSLGIMIMEILTGAKERQKIEDVLESWDNRSELSQENSHYEQVRVCAEIGIECTNIDPTKRPVSMTNIMDRLAEIERTEVVQAKYSRQLLKVQSLELRFPFNPNMPNACALHLTNNTDKCVAFRLKNTVEESWLKDDFGKLLLYGIVPPRSTYTLLVTTTKETELPRETKIDLSLQTSVAGEDIQPFKRNEECNHYFEQVKKQGDALNEVALKVVCDPQEKIIPFMGVTSWLQCVDAHPTEPWIIFGDFYKQVHIWNYDTQSIDQSFKESKDAVWSTKIIARKQWILAGDVKGYIHVYHYGAKPMKIRSLRSSTCSRITTLAIHPTKSYVLSATFYYIDLWDWDNDWKCTQTFLGHSGTVFQVAFNPRDHDSFVSASWDNTVKVWNLNSPESIFTLSGHSGVVTCLDFFTRDNQQYLITCSSDQTAKIWDMHQRMCIHTIKGFTSPVTCIISLPDRPSLVTGSEDGLVRLWSSSDYRLERIFDIGRTTIVVAVACLKGSNRIVIGQRERVSIMDIDDE